MGLYTGPLKTHRGLKDPPLTNLSKRLYIPTSEVIDPPPAETNFSYDFSADNTIEEF